MKTISALAILLLTALTAAAQTFPISVRATNGTAYGPSLYGPTNRGTSKFFGPVIFGTNQTFSIGLGQDGLFDFGNWTLDSDGTFTAPFGTNISKFFIGNGGGLTNLASATNFPSGPNYVFNGKVTLNSNVYITTLSFPTNRWPGPTNTLLLNTNYLNFVASGDCAITNVGGQDSTMNTWATVTISNSTASDITVRTTASGVRLQGASTTAALVIGTGKEGYLSFHCRGVLSTNLVTSTQQ